MREMETQDEYLNLRVNTYRMNEDKIKISNKIYIQDFFRIFGFGSKMLLLCWWFTAIYYFIIMEAVIISDNVEDYHEYSEADCYGFHMIDYVYGSFADRNTCIKKQE